MGAETIGAIAGAPLGPVGILTGFQVGAGVESAAMARRARRRQEGLEEERRAQLLRESRQRQASQERAAVRGRTTGARATFFTNLGFGTGNAPVGLGRGTLFGN